MSSKVAKRIVGEDRPLGAVHRETYGMPSSHATNLTYFAVCIVANQSTPFLVKVAALVALVVLLWWRVMRDYHTLGQILAGCGLGFIIACLWWVDGGVATMIAPLFVQLGGGFVV